MDRPVALVTGAARGIGAATARRLHAAGFQLVLLDSCTDDPALAYALATPAELAAVAAECGGAAHHQVDVRDADALRTLVAPLDRLDVAVAAAGAIAGGPPMWETNAQQWRAMIDINLGGVWNLAQATVPKLLESDHGRFVAVASAASTVGLPQLAAYSAAKHGVAGLIKALAAELGPSGVTANAVAPGSTSTAMLDASAAVYDLADAEEFADQQRIGRLIRPDEVAATIAYLCSPEASAITGAIIPVDGGLTS